MKTLIQFSLITILMCLFQIAGAQTVINRYYPVLTITPPSGSGATCDDPTGGGLATPLSMTVGPGVGAASPALAGGMQVLIIQMMAGSAGAINQTNTSSYGTVSNSGGAGNYEFAIIRTPFDGTNITFTTQLVNTYDVAGKVQIIPVVPVASYTVAATGIMARPFTTDNTTGGVLVLDVTGTLTLNGNILANAGGFAGGDTIGIISSTNSISGRIQYGCCAGTGANANSMTPNYYGMHYYLPEIAGEPRTDVGGAPGNNRCNGTNGSTSYIGKGARKGFGIFGRYSGQELSWGKFANSGGGAHGFNTGGGGGGGFSPGGNGGGEQATYSCNPAADVGGRGGDGFNGGTTALLMGGGGGAGHGEGPYGNLTLGGITYQGPTSGGKGGGIIIIRANQITGGGFTINAKGGNARLFANRDGGGGGGGGGSIVLDVGSFSGALTVDARGGIGSSTLQGDNHCHGPGGGGGGGRVTFRGAAPGGVTVTTASGASGLAYQDDGTTPRSCNQTTTSQHMSTSGTVGVISPNYSINTQVCTTTPVTLMNFYAALNSDNAVGIYWKTATEKNSSHFVVERSSDAKNFEAIGTVKAHGNSNEVISYSFTDEEVSTFSGTVYYRLRMVDFDDTYEYSPLAGVVLKGAVVSIYPNPVKEDGGINVVYYSYVENEEISVSIGNILGQLYHSLTANLVKGNNEIHLSTQGLSAGIYFVEVNSKYGKTVEKIIIE